MSFIIQMLWQCKHCNHRNQGLTGEDEGLRCKGCGNQRSTEPWIMPDDPTRAPVVTEPVLLRRANAGPVWECGFCRHSERAENQECSVCGAPRGRSEPATPSVRLPARSPVPPGAATLRSSDIELPLNFRPSHKKWFIAGALALIALIWLLSWLFGTHTAVAQVTAVHWERRATVQERHIKAGADWDGNMPGDAFDTDCDRRLRRHERCHPHDCNPHKVSYSCNCSGGDRYACGTISGSCTSNNNGSARCSSPTTRYCTRPRTCQTCYRTEYDTCYDQCPVFDNWCEFKHPVWEPILERQEAGDDLKPRWPILEADGAEQRLIRKERYQVRLQYADHIWNHEPNANDFVRYGIGTTHKVQYSRAGLFKVLD